MSWKPLNFSSEQLYAIKEKFFYLIPECQKSTVNQMVDHITKVTTENAKLRKDLIDSTAQLALDDEVVLGLRSENAKLRELLKSVARDSDLWFNAHCDNKKITADCFFDGHRSLLHRIQSALREE